MKQVIAIVGIGIMAASCNTTAVREKEATLQAKEYTIDSMKIEMAKRHVIDSMNNVLAVTQEPVKEVQVVRKKKRAARSYASVDRQVAVTNNDSYSGYSNTTPATPSVQAPPVVQQPVEVKKKGWSAKAKGAAIGAGTGAVAGAIIHKRQRAVGAVVGGVLGAGAGLGIGAVIDKKNGR